MRHYVIKAGDNPEDYMQAAQDAGCDAVLVGFPDGVTRRGPLDLPTPDDVRAAALAELSAAVSWAQAKPALLKLLA